MLGSPEEVRQEIEDTIKDTINKAMDAAIAKAVEDRGGKAFEAAIDQIDIQVLARLGAEQALEAGRLDKDLKDAVATDKTKMAMIEIGGKRRSDAHDDDSAAEFGFVKRPRPRQRPMPLSLPQHAE
ncbi:hypothetical protein NUW58_g1747 [Xylaria curta]|uniref:Uncharacterized protein n=2 Tax=Xylaria curta TaxID=42375 RepID=A0ACC1NUW1_9PEZI|nr:hypothetical protein NUW58_g6389 [Xylaria curta]KAJ2993764.1 hypothetical protein NUW58_g1747 [Xylaria curta]